MSAYTRAVQQAEAAKASHYTRMAALVREHAAGHPHNFDNGYGEIDTALVEQRARRDWWQRRGYWTQGQSVEVVERPVEREAIAAIWAGEDLNDGATERISPQRIQPHPLPPSPQAERGKCERRATERISPQRIQRAQRD